MAEMLDPRSRWENGRRVTDWSWEAVTVHGGFRIARRRWVLGPQGWEQEESELVAAFAWMRTFVFTTRAAADSVIAILSGAEGGAW
jgi:hypothetical protein